MTPSRPPHTPACDPREAFAASLERLRARGLDVEALVARAQANLKHWREHPAPWDATVAIDEETP